MINDGSGQRVGTKKRVNNEQRMWRLHRAVSDLEEFHHVACESAGLVARGESRGESQEGRVPVLSLKGGGRRESDMPYLRGGLRTLLENPLDLCPLTSALT